ncbi:S8 family serine peptidase [Rhizohabitans arisaemae]|uniref:S8 family serine peptidase n=1 Tax=Rhizohabitans arisaemae TaxID=2720610 RepID=UPI0024B0D13D|nr:S8 family serine peptidase [Rhizohabitans arisaemae]
MRCKTGIAALAVVVAASVFTPPSSVHADPGKPSAPRTAGKPADVPKYGDVTLITGDRVTVAAGPAEGSPQVEEVVPGKGRDVTFVQRRRDDHLYVIPSDAMSPIARGLLDERLFNVTQLLAWGYGDAQRDDIPVIVQSDAKAATPRLKAAEDTRAFAGLGLASSRLPKNQATETWTGLGGSADAKTLAGGVTKLWLDGKRQPTLERSVPQIGAPAAWAQGLTGEGVTVAVVDTGYDATHPDLRDVVVQSKSFKPGAPPDADPNGHGTHVASILAGSGQASSGKNRGVAPGARLAVAKVGDEMGMPDSEILAGMLWAITEVKAKIVNMSLGGSDGAEIDPLEHAVNTLTAQHGTLFVIAAGNEGPRSIASPGSADAALTVGAVDPADRLVDWSSTGPRNWDKAVKPDITAPGSEIIAAAAAGTAPDPYTPMSGTSMSAPHVAGAAAILAQRNPTWTAEQLKAALIGSAVPTAGTGVFAQGAGRVDVARAIAQPVTASPSTLSTVLPWAQSGTPVTKTVVYRNSGTAPLTLDLTVEQSGGPLPDGLLELPVRQVTVPAGGEAPVTFTLNPAGVPTGAYAAVLVARSGEVTVRTPVGAHVEPESYNVTVQVTGLSTDRTSGSATLYNPATREQMEVWLRDGKAQARLTAGAWILVPLLFSRELRRFITAYRSFRAEADAAPVVLDGKQVRPATFSVDEPTAIPANFISFAIADRQDGTSWSYGTGIFGRDANTLLGVIPVTQPGVAFAAWTTWQQQGAVLSPYRYDLVKYHEGGIPDPVYAAKTADLAKSEVTFRRVLPTAGTGLLGSGLIMGTRLDQVSTRVALPGTLIHYRTPGQALAWQSALTDRESRTQTYEVARARRHGNSTEVWPTAAFGPALRPGHSTRTGDELRYIPSSLFADGSPRRYSNDWGLQATATLTKDGQTLGRIEFTSCMMFLEFCTLKTSVPPGEAVYTLTTAAQRNPGAGGLSTATETAWTFRSSRTERPQALPLMTVRYRPMGLDQFNRARAGTLTPIPLQVEGVPGSPAPAVRTLTVEASADDGATWRRIPVLPSPGGWTAFVLNPAAGDFVSLRTVAVDRAGTTVKQTITRAYALAS